MMLAGHDWLVERIWRQGRFAIEQVIWNQEESKYETPGVYL
ncbi:MAG: hypothetical protein Ct9H90mP27_2090 [Gammaproteobacteria bacterium]|nr:MAG: hypothetical protein Ct9H90mP27_2090 [Gammaproteobacteria bacterium]